MKPKEAQALQDETKQLLELWQRYRNAMDLATLTQEQITSQHESAFLDTKSAMTRLGRSLSQELPKDINFDARRMADITKSSISVQHFRGIPEAEIPQIRADWHAVWVQLSRAYGAIIFLAEGGKPAPAKKGPTPIKGKKGKKKNKFLVPGMIAGAIAAAVAAAFFLNLI